MDPASIISAATSAARGALEVYALCHEAKYVNQTVDGLAKEAKALGDACETVAKRPELIIKEADIKDSPSNKMQHLLKSRISDCQGTVTQLMASLQGLDNGSLNFLERLGKQIRLNARAADIAEARSQLRSHTDALQLILHVLSIEISHLLPRKADQRLCTLIAKVEQQIEHLLGARSQDVTAECSEQDELLAYSRETVLSAYELYRESQANGSIDPPPTDEKIQEIKGWVQDVSEHAAAKNVNVSGDQASLDSSNRALVDSDNRSRRSRNTIVDTSLQLALAKVALTAAASSYRKGDYEECTRHLLERSGLVSTLPEHEVIRCNQKESEFRLALALESLQVIGDTSPPFLACEIQNHLDQAAELIKPLSMDLHEKYFIAENQVRTRLARLTLSYASRLFVDKKFKHSQQCLSDFVQFQKELNADAAASLYKEECSVRMEIAQTALENAKKQFDSRNSNAYRSILEAREEVVKTLPASEKARCGHEEYQFYQVLGRELLDLARKSIATENFLECLRLLKLREGLLTSKEVEQTADCDTLKPLYLRAVCICSTATSESRDDNVSALLEAFDEYDSKMPDLTEELQLDLHSLSFILSQQCVGLADFDEAQYYCNIALAGYRNTLGALHEKSAGCHALMARILELKGEHIKARYHRSLIPEAHLELPKVKEMLSQNVNGKGHRKPTGQKSKATKSWFTLKLTAHNSAPDLERTIIADKKGEAAKRASQPLIQSHDRSQVTDAVSNSAPTVSEQSPKQRFIVKLASAETTVACVKASPASTRRPRSIVFHCDSGAVTLRESFGPPPGLITKEECDELATAYWDELIDVCTTITAAAAATQSNCKGVYFSKHTTGKGHLPYKPKIDLCITADTLRAKTCLTLSPGHVRMLSKEQIQWAYVKEQEVTDKILRKIANSVSGGMIKKPQSVPVFKIEYLYE